MGENNLSVEGIIVDENRPTTRKTRVMASKQQVVRVDREATHYIDDTTAGRLLKVLEKALESADALLLQDYNKGVLSPSVIKAAIASARNMDKVITVDPKFQNFFEYENVTLFKPNIRELKYALGSAHPDNRTLEKMMSDLQVRISSRYILLTCGEDGMALLDEKGDFTKVPAICRDVYDVSGAGDTVISTVTLALASGGDVWESSILSNYAASVEVQRSGVSTVSEEEILAAMKRYGGLIEP
jgi:rfaE bifunctional protein kinase chain/domain